MKRGHSLAVKPPRTRNSPDAGPAAKDLRLARRFWFHEAGAASLNGQARLTLLLWTRIEQPAQQPAAVTLEEGSTNIVSWLHGPWFCELQVARCGSR
jgi:hypothetical protein